MKATAETLHKAHPKVVEVVLKKSDNWVGVNVRHDVKVQWKKALKK